MFRLFRKLFGNRFVRKPLASRPRRRGTPRLESLEDRCVPATVFVDPNVAASRSVFTSIGAAVTASNNGDTIKVVAGTYNEAVVVNKSLTILGGQVHIAGRENPGQSIVTSGSLPFMLDASNVTIEGFTITTGSVGVAGVGTFSGFHILSDRFLDDHIGVDLNAQPNASTTKTTISGNSFTNDGAGVGTRDDIRIDGAGSSNVVVSNNVFVNGAETEASIIVDTTNASTNIQILDNSFSAEVGVLLANVADTLVESNLFVNPLTTAILLDGGVTNTEVARNTILATKPIVVGGIVLGTDTVNSPDTGNSILGNTVHGMGVGILVSPANHTTISSNTIAFCSGDGIEVNDASSGSVSTPIANVISANTVVSNGGVGILVTSDRGDTVSRNVVEHNQQGGISLSSTTTTMVAANTADFNTGDGIGVSGSNNTLTGNTADANSGNGITVGASNNTVTGNTADFNLVGIDVPTNLNTISNNVAEHNATIGFDDAGNNDTLTGNTARGNPQEGLLVAGIGDSLNSNVAVDNGGQGFLIEDGGTFTSNTASNNALEGFNFQGGRFNILLKANVANDNGTGGILLVDVNSGNTTTITGNTADGNGLDGIELTGSLNCSVTGNTARNNVRDGIDLDSVSRGNTISGNTALGNGLGAGDYDLFDESGATTNNTWTNNTANTRFPGGLG